MMEMATIEGDHIVISVPIAALADACKVAWDEEYGIDEHSLRVTDPVLFAVEFVGELNREEEDGTTLVHEMLDKAVIRATEEGADGIGGEAVAPVADEEAEPDGDGTSEDEPA